jgi:tetratricopeptide (TPR) repeat protein
MDEQAGRNFIRELFVMAQKGSDNSALTTALSYLCEFTLVEDELAGFRALWAVLSEGEPDRLLFGALSTICEYLRDTFGFTRDGASTFSEGTAFLEVLAASRSAIDEFGWQRLVAYAERLGDEGTLDALALLRASRIACEERFVSLADDWRAVTALKLFKQNSVHEALGLVRKVHFDELPLGAQARVSFIEGRCLQYRQEYEAAVESFQRGFNSDSDYGSMCRHQLGFIRFLRDSDYREAASVLSENLANHASTLLCIQCLIELGEYARSQELIESETRWRSKERKGLTYGKVKRVEAQLFSRLFIRERALHSAEEAEECMKERRDLSFANVLETKGSLLGVLYGDIGTAESLLAESIALAEQGERHYPTLSWSLQSRAFLRVLSGVARDVEVDLAAALRFHSNPNQQRRDRLARLMLRHRQGYSDRTALLHDYRQLEEDYRNAGQTWYAGIAGLLIARIEGRLSYALRAASTIFGASVDVEGLQDSFLAAQLLSFPS